MPKFITYVDFVSDPNTVTTWKEPGKDRILLILNSDTFSAELVPEDKVASNEDKAETKTETEKDHLGKSSEDTDNDETYPSNLIMGYFTNNPHDLSEFNILLSINRDTLRTLEDDVWDEIVIGLHEILSTIQKDLNIFIINREECSTSVNIEEGENVYYISEKINFIDILKQYLNM